MWFRSLTGSFKSSASNATRSKKRRQNRRRPDQRPRLESLESRALLTFMAPVAYPAPFNTTVAAVGDLANNGIQDLVLANADSINVLMGNGDGTFRAAQNVDGDGASSLAVGDLNGDGKLDIVTAVQGGNVSVLLGNGDGSFRAPITFTTPLHVQSIALGDMNHDGRLDVVVTGSTSGAGPTYIGSEQVDVLLGREDGTLSLASMTSLGRYVGGGELAVSDFNGDGSPDVAVTVSNSVAVLSGDGDGGLSPPTYFPTGGNVWSVTAADINGDGKPDLVTVNFNESVSVLLGNGDGSFEPPDNVALPSWNAPGQSGPLAQLPQDVVVGDLNGDGKMDLAVVAEAPSGDTYLNYENVNILLGDGAGDFTAAQVVPLDYIDADPFSLTAADFNGDGYPDLAVGDNNPTFGDNVQVLLNGGNGSTGAQASSFSVSGFPTSTTAGTAGSFTVTALNADGTVDTGYSGTVRFSSSDGQAALPAAYTFAAADAGKHTFSATLKTAGTQSITATDSATGTLTGSETGITVTPAAASHFAVSAPASSTAGGAFSVTVTALDAYNNTATGYAGTVHFTSSDGQAILPGNYTFTSGDAGKYMFTNAVTLKTAGSQTLTVTDTSSSAITGAATVSVSPAAPSTILVSGFPSSITAGAAGSFTVTALNADGTVDTAYTGTVRFISSDAKAVLPASYTFTATDAGKHTFSATLKTAGTQSITAADTVNASLHGADSGITVKPAAASKFVLSAPSSVKPGVAFSLTVTVEDQYGNIVTGYIGTIHFSSSDSRARLPANYTFKAGDNGVHTFTGLVLRKAGNQTITVSDTHNRGITGKTMVDVV